MTVIIKRTRQGKRLILLLMFAFLLSFAAPASAQNLAGSIVYIKDNNIWLADPNIEYERPVTADGTRNEAYATPSQADDGTIVARRGDFLLQMDRYGNLLNSFRPPIILPLGISNVRVSPDGRLVAYETARLCQGPWGEWMICMVTYVIASDGSDSEPSATLYFYGSPSWIDNSQLAVSHFHQAIAVYTLGGDDPVLWIPYEDTQNGFLDEPEVSRDGSKVAVARGGDIELGRVPATIWLYTTNGAPPARPTARCATNPGRFANPTWEPNGNAVAWVEPNGIWMYILLGDIGADDCTVLPVYIDAGNQPHWGPAPVD